MPASSFRKEKRKLQQLSGAEGSVQDVQSRPAVTKKKKTKFGRKEMRSITRAGSSRRGGYQDDQEESEQSEDYQSEESEVESDAYGDNEDGGKGSSKLDEQNMTYSALLTLLKSDHPEEEKKPKSKKRKIQEAKDEEDSEGEEDMDEEDKLLKEINVEDSEDDELAEEVEFDEDEEFHNKFDSFDLHFNDTKKIDQLIKEFEKNSKSKEPKKLLKITEKTKFDDLQFNKLKYEYDLSGNVKEEESKISRDRSLNYILKYYNVKQNIRNKFSEIKSASNQFDKDLIDSIISYTNVNLQYDTNEHIKSKYQDYYLLHIINHLEKTKDRILNNNFKKAKVVEKIESGEMKPEDEPEFRDQGYNRPKVLILLPTRDSVWDLVNKLIKLTKSMKIISSVENFKKFESQFYDEFEIQDKKSQGFKENFKGNSNDFFVFCLKFTKKTLKLFSKFEQSDIIIASPLGLKMVLEKQSSKDKLNSKFKTREKVSTKIINNTNDFMSSIEITILDKADFLMMQNFEHISDIFNKFLNKTPINYSKIDFSRIRMWLLNDNSKYVMQFLNFTNYSTPELNNLILERSKTFQNLSKGSVIYKPIYNDSNSIINGFKLNLVKMGLINNHTRLRQIFMRFGTSSIKDEPNDRFKFFTNVIIPILMNKVSYQSGILIYIPSYYDYLRIKSYFQKTSLPNLSVLSIDEYSSQSKLTSNRALFHKTSQGLSSKAKIILYTERLHFYKRFEIKGVKNVVFYGLPSDPIFYSEVLQFIVDNKVRIDMSLNNKFEQIDGDKESEKESPVDLNLALIRVLFSKLDFWKLERLVGLNKSGVLCTTDNEINEFN